MLCFGGIATWRFGTELAEFGTYERALQTEFEMLFGSFPANWNQNQDLRVFVVLYLMILFLLVLNFLLAIIVEAYMRIREDIESQETEGEFFTDVLFSFSAFVRGHASGWPNQRVLAKEILSWKAKVSVGHRELLDTGLFRSAAAVVSFLRFYSQYDFMKPPKIGKYGKSPDLCGEWNAGGSLETKESAILAHMIVSRMKKDMEENNHMMKRIVGILEKRPHNSHDGTEEQLVPAIGAKGISRSTTVKTLRDQVKDAINEVAHRHKLRGRHDQASEIQSMLSVSASDAAKVQNLRERAQSAELSRTKALQDNEDLGKTALEPNEQFIRPNRDEQREKSGRGTQSDEDPRNAMYASAGVGHLEILEEQIAGSGPIFRPLPITHVQHVQQQEAFGGAKETHGEAKEAYSSSSSTYGENDP